MSDNVVNLKKPKELMPSRWRKHADALNQRCAEIDALRMRLKQETRDFLDAMKEDMDPIDHLVSQRQCQQRGAVEVRAQRFARADRQRLASCPG